MDSRGVLRGAVVLAAIGLAGPGAAGATAKVSIQDVVVTEGETVSFRLVSDALLGDVVSVATADGTAKAGEDYTAVDRPAVAVPAGAEGTTITVATAPDGVSEPDETFELVATTPVTGEVVKARATIRNDDAPAIAFGAAPVKEGAPLKVGVGLVHPTTKPVSVRLATVDGSAQGGPDFTPTITTVQFAPGEQAKVVEVPTADDAVFEGDEALVAQLSQATNATVGADKATLAILENDPMPTLTIQGAPPVAEGDSGTTLTGAALVLSAPAGVPVTVIAASAPSGAKAGEDFEPVTGEVVFAPGETVKPFLVNVKGDTDVEKDERFFVIAAPRANAQADGGAVSTVLTIRNDDRDTTAPAIRMSRPEVKGTRLVARLACPATETRCSGRVTFFKDADRRAKDRRVRRELRLGSVAVRVDGGAKQTLTLRLSAGERALLRRARRARISAYALVRDSAGNDASERTRRTLRFAK